MITGFGFALEWFTRKIQALDEFTVEKGGEVPPNSERVDTLKWYAKESNREALGIAPYLTEP